MSKKTIGLLVVSYAAGALVMREVARTMGWVGGKA